MKKLMVLIGTAVILGTFSLAEGQIDTVTLLHLNDTHSHLLPYGPKDGGGNWTWGGMARIATLVGTNRVTEPNVMLLHAGDIFVGDFMFQKYLDVPIISSGAGDSESRAHAPNESISLDLYVKGAKHFARILEGMGSYQ